MTQSRNYKSVAHENGSIENLNVHLKRAINDALIMRGSRGFADLASYRRFIDVVVGRINAHNANRVDLERACLKPLPTRRTTDYQEVTVRVTFRARSCCAKSATPSRPGGVVTLTDPRLLVH